MVSGLQISSWVRGDQRIPALVGFVYRAREVLSLLSVFFYFDDRFLLIFSSPFSLLTWLSAFFTDGLRWSATSKPSVDIRYTLAVSAESLRFLHPNSTSTKNPSTKSLLQVSEDKLRAYQLVLKSSNTYLDQLSTWS